MRTVATFEELAARSDDDIDVALGAALIARDVYPEVDVTTLLGRLDDLAAPLAAAAFADRPAHGQADGLAHYMYDTCGFTGNEADYYDPKNSLLPDVLDRRLGIPISTVALGTYNATIPNPVDPMGAPIEVPPDPETLRQIAQVSGGRAFTTADAEKLTSIYQSLGSTLATRKEHREITVGFAAAGLVLLLGAGIASVRGSGPLP